MSSAKSANISEDDSLHSLLQDLEIPSEYARYDSITEAETIARLEFWQSNVSSILSELNTKLKQRSELTLEQQTKVVSVASQFDGDGDWISHDVKILANDVLAHFADPSVVFLEHLLTNRIKPIFRSNPHPSLNPSTGRRLPRPTGGPLAAQDYYEDQTWKNHPGAANLTMWCIRHLQAETYERVWHLVIPPVMTLLDDYEAQYKLQGIAIISEILLHVPKDLLKRTGIDSLLFTSLKTTLTFLHNPNTPSLIRVAVPTTISLILLTTSPGSSERFDQLCILLGEGIIGGVWIYASRDVDTIQASVEVIPQLVSALGVGSVRYLKAMIPQLTHPLQSDLVTFNPDTIPLKLTSLRALRSVIQECSPRIHRWKGAILEGAAKCWVVVVESGRQSEDVRDLKVQMKALCAELAKTCPSVLQEEYPRLLELDAGLFGELLPSDISLESQIPDGTPR
ncbi:hypothetical protein JAAARDRAFT_685072 [Jaapia argillacea MUCL 33604]|uniref:Uncharacterized protein n=1 Tax=Jaapia argillacea MUCL 33604 TaxID=933084 RepID=A0A067QNC2_9AGAM|nr:hypothetical protein JAAARDRAFT_685072 [Jaapia argillacea MUCL 33604]